MDILRIYSTGILQEKGWGIYHMDVYEVAFNLYFILQKLLSDDYPHEFRTLFE